MPDNEYIYMLRLNRPEMLTEGPTEEEAAIRSRHVDYIQGLLDQVVLVLAGRTQTGDGSSRGLVIFRAEDAAAAQRVMQADPAVAEGLMTAELFPFPVVFEGSFTRGGNVGPG